MADGQDEGGRTDEGGDVAFRLPRDFEDRAVHAMTTVAPGTVEADRPATPPPIVESTGKYRICEELGHGGMGRVWRCHDVLLARDVAMKTLLEGTQAGTEQVAQLVREAQITGRLEHPNIVPVYELGVLADGQHFYTMKLVQEMTLQDLLERLRGHDADVAARYPLHRLLGLFQQICIGIHHAHRSGVVHRDLKPANVLIGQFGEVQVMDWGLAARLDEPIPERLRVPPGAPGGGASDARSTPSFVGTPLYLAPEVLRGELAFPDVRSDVYALGVILYEILTLRWPYEAPTLSALGEAILRGELVPPHLRAPKQDIPPALERIALRALAAAPDARYPSAVALFEAIEVYREGNRREEEWRAKAREELTAAEEALAHHAELQRQKEALDDRIRRSQAAHRPVRWSGADGETRRLLAERDTLEIFVGEAFARALDHFVRTLAFDPENPRARETLAGLYRTLLKPAAERADIQTMLYFATAVRRLSAGTPQRGAEEGTVSIRSFPEGAEIVLHDVGPLGPRDGASGPRTLGTTPLMDVRIPAGTYVAIARAAGYRDTKSPVLVFGGERSQTFIALQPWQLEEPLVGRSAEFDWLKRVASEALRGRRPVSCLVRGRGGMGKTQLLDAFDEYLESLPEVVALFFASARRTHPLLPYAPLADMIAFRAGIRRDDLAASRRAKLEAMVLDAFAGPRGRPTRAESAQAQAVVEGLGLLPELDGAASDADLPPGERRRRLQAALRSFVGRVARNGAALVSLRAYESFDASSRAFVASLCESLPNAPLILLAARTDAEVGALPEGTAFDHVIALEPLPLAAAEWYVHGRLEGEIAPLLTDTLHRLSGGRPDHLDALVSLLVSNGLVRRRRGRWDLVAGAELPSGVQSYRETVARQVVGTLAPAELALLQRAAVAGRSFAREELEALQVPDIDRLLGALVTRRVIAHHPSGGLLWRAVYSFPHEMVHRVCLEGLPVEQRRRDHLTLASTLVARPAPQAELTALVARHLEEAGEHALAADAYAVLAQHARDYAAEDEAAECERRAAAARAKVR